MKPLAITAHTATSCLGLGLEAQAQALRAQLSGLTPCTFMDLGLKTWIGEVGAIDVHPLPEAFLNYECRNNRLARIGFEQDGFDGQVRRAIEQYGASRVGLFLGSSTSGLLSTELAYRNRDPSSGALPPSLHYAETHNMFSLASFVKDWFDMTGPASVVSVACASSAKVFATAARAIEVGLIDAALVGGVDSLCLTTLYGFGSLELLSTEVCRPFDAARSGISIAEAAGFALLERAMASSDQQAEPAMYLLGFGESSDAYHMSSPHPEGWGAQQAMKRALREANLANTDIDYINLHGTATPSNDSAEDAAVFAVFDGQVPVSSTKGAHGHTLGAAGALEAAVSLIALREQFMPAGLNVKQLDASLKSPYLTQNRPARLRRVMSNSFGFGGANCSLVFGVEAS